MIDDAATAGPVTTASSPALGAIGIQPPEPDHNPEPVRPFTAATIFQYLAFDREAVRTVASTRWSLVVGVLLVLSGGLARNYDGAYLPAEWPALTHGVIVSTVNATVLFTLAWLLAHGRRGAPYGRGLVAFIGLFWMTAPMAWLYGLPYERWLSPAGAISANAWTLGLVSLWRIALATRALSVLLGVRKRHVFWAVMLFSDALLLLALRFAPVPLVDFMGGLQQTPEERELAAMAFLAGFGGVITAPVWLIGAAVAAWKMLAVSTPPVSAMREAPRAALAVAGCAVVFWLGVHGLVRPEQRNRYEAETLLRSGDVAGALQLMSAHARTDYPPVWDPPPRPAWGVHTPSIDALRRALAEHTPALWVADLMWPKCWRTLVQSTWRRWSFTEPAGVDGVRSDDFSPEWLAAAALHARADTTLDQEMRAALERLLERSGSTPPRQ